MPAEVTKTDTETADPQPVEEGTSAAKPATDRPIRPSTVDIQTPQFSALRDSGKSAADNSVRRFMDVSVTVSAELGRVEMPIADLLDLGEGSVVELQQPVTGPIDLVANGVRIARGEVVVVDDCFAIRIKQIDS
jgi:flagellar motor switch protein FliN/FliY